MTTTAPILALKGITKRFPGVLANDRIDLALRPGEVHVLLGENGAGKSTIVAMLSGLIQPDSGRIEIEGRPVTIRSPRHALSLGIGTVFQHSMLVPSLTVAENLLLGAPWWRRPARREMAARLGEIAAGLGMAVRPEMRAGDLSLGEQQQAEILRALVRGGRVLILDESTSMLTPDGIAELGALMRRMAGQGLAILFITHKLGEAVSFGDRISVLKLGRKVGEIPPERIRGEETVGEVLEMMFGARTAGAADTAPPAPPRPGRRLVVEGLSLPARDGAPALEGISFDVAPGEILGIAGIDGNGQRELAEALAGQRRAGGRVLVDGRDLSAQGVGGRRRAGLRYLTDDRLGEGTVGAFPVSLNLVLKEVGAPPFWRAGLERRAVIDAHARDRVRAFDVRTPGVATPVGRLSGGNIQKVILARELVPGARVVVFSKPTYGLDLANARATHQRIRDLAAQGIAVVLISTDLEELLALSHRIAVMSGGRIAGIVANDAEARARIGRLMVGVAA
ncbi:MAG: ABC transporter ATP-binding protein [Alphaproteobacteria bacterium]|nr:MAG: ABC transporter ATP-binding protein [Alphaproteobacteria bacterium]